VLLKNVLHACSNFSLPRNTVCRCHEHKSPVYANAIQNQEKNCPAQEQVGDPVPRSGYGLGAKSLELGYQARVQLNVPRVAREYLEKLAVQTGDTVHLGVLDGTRALYLDKIPGGRRVEISSRVGELQPLRSTGLGKALLLDEDEVRLKDFYRCEEASEQHYEVSESTWMRRMREYAKLGYTFDLEENEDRIRCVAAPVRDATGRIKAAISVSSAAQYMNDARMQALAKDVRRTAEQISRELGWEGSATGKTNPKAA